MSILREIGRDLEGRVAEAARANMIKISAKLRDDQPATGIGPCARRPGKGVHVDVADRSPELVDHHASDRAGNRRVLGADHISRGHHEGGGDEQSLAHDLKISPAPTRANVVPRQRTVMGVYEIERSRSWSMRHIASARANRTRRRRPPGRGRLIEGLAAMAAAIGCSGVAAPLDDEACRNLGLNDLVLDAHVAAGKGALRALFVVTRPELSLRDLLVRLAARLRRVHRMCSGSSSPRSPQRPRSRSSRGRTNDARRALLPSSPIERASSTATPRRAPLGSVETDHDLLTHSRWVEILGRGALTIRFYRALERAVNTIAQSTTVGSEEVRGEIALLDASRLLFLSFLEAKGWLDGDRAFLSGRFDRCGRRADTSIIESCDPVLRNAEHAGTAKRQPQRPSGGFHFSTAVYSRGHRSSVVGAGSHSPTRRTAR